MLTLTRNIGKQIIIGEDIVVTILGVQGGTVRIGVEADRNTQVHRREIYDKIQAEKGGDK